MTFLSMMMFFTSVGQTNITYDLKKPTLYENRKLPSELTPDRKINPVKRVKENITSHYNYYFNANIKLNTVVSSAKQSFRDTFSNLLPVFNFTLDQTSSQQTELDSVIIKTNNGVLLHDLRNDWVDDMYLLMGQAYFYEKKFDSAYDVFQYINYNFQPRKKDEIGFEKNIGSNINGNESMFQISTREKPGVQGPLGKNASRNEALIWIARTLMEMENDDDAKSLINTLDKDRQFPSRLKENLNELKGYWFYKKQMVDSAAFYLENSMGACSNIQEKARRFYLIAQLYTKSSHPDKAYHFFEKSISLTTDPILEANARIQQVGLQTSGEKDDAKRAEANIQALLQMARREKYLNYRGLIYASAAEIAIGKGKTTDAISYWKSSNLFSPNDPDQKNKNSLNIAQWAFESKQYELAKSYYDSIRIENLPNAEDISLKKSIVGDLIKNMKTVKLEDSLQRIAKLTEKERDEYLKELLKKLKKEQEQLQSAKQFNSGIKKTTNILDANSGSLFQTDNKKGEWYFNNQTLKAQGSIDFKNTWGDRPNVDNWRRVAALNAVLNKKINPGNIDTSSQKGLAEQEITIESLKEKLPLTKEKMVVSDSIRHSAMRNMAVLYKEKLGNCEEATKLNETLAAEAPSFEDIEKVLFDLSYCFKQMGSPTKADMYQEAISKKFPSSQYNEILKDPLSAAKKQKNQSEKITKAYDKIYDLFLSGKFVEAITEKKKADSLYGENHWSPQLLYIESVYYIKQKQDSIAIATLNKIPALYPNSPLAERAGSIADVLNRRADIETELKNLQVTRAVEEKNEYVSEHVAPAQKVEGIGIKQKEKNQLQLKPIESVNVKMDSSMLKTVKVEQKSSTYTFDANEKTNVILVLKNVDPVFQSEAKRALARYHAGKYPNRGFELTQDKVGEIPFIMISIFNNTVEALDYVEQARILGPKEIFPWLPAEKYQFLLISSQNLKQMQVEKNIENYLRFIKAELPGKF